MKKKKEIPNSTLKPNNEFVSLTEDIKLTDISVGLTDSEVAFRVENKQVNKEVKKRSKSYLQILFDNVFSIFNLAMFGIFGWLVSVKASLNNYVFIVVLLLNITIGVIQEIKAKKKIESLSLLNAPIVKVTRNSTLVELGVESVVLDDIVTYTAGNQVTSDSKIREGKVEVNESMLTGESTLVIKTVGDYLYSGSFIVSGKCIAQVVAVGKNNYINKVSLSAKKYKKAKSSLYSSLRIVLTILTIIAAGLVSFLYIRMKQTGLLTYAELVEKTAGSAIGMLPTGLLLCTSVALAVGVIRLYSKKTLVQEIFAIETLARVDTLCLDKTGTITDGTMSVVKIIEYKNPTKLSFKNIIQGLLNAEEGLNITSNALIEKFGKAKKLKYDKSIPFSSDRKFQAITLTDGTTYALGAPEFVIKDNYKDIKFEVERQALEGYRVLCLGYSNKPIENEKIDKAMIPLALIMIEDTIRHDAIRIIKEFESQGVNIKVISGDNPMTVSRIAMKVGIKDAANYISLEGMDDKDVELASDKYQVFGRVSPNQKKILVKALKKKGHTVAMTGDGVNDVLALREADTSIAMASGSDAARNVSHIVLMDSNFSSMTSVVAEGRRVINNIAKVATLFLTKTIFSIILSVIGIIKGYYPISPSQLLLVEFLVIGFPSFFLALENNSKKISGNFIVNIFKSSLPGALAVAFNAIIIYLLSPFFGTLNNPVLVDGVYQFTRMSAEYVKNATSTLITLSATFTSLFVLARVCYPFNKFRLSLFITMATLCVLIATFVPNLLGNLPFYEFISLSQLEPLGIFELLLLILLIVISLPLMYFFSNIVKWIKLLFKSIFKKIGTIGNDDL